MLASSTDLLSSNIASYTRSGQAMSLFRSEPAQRVVPAPSTSTDNGQNSEDIVTLSQEGLDKSQQQGASANASQDTATTESSQATKQAGTSSSGPQDLTAEEQVVVQELKQRDQEVKSHEMAHLANAGQYARGGASYTYQQGPDGRRYAVGGEVPIDVSAEKTPEETIKKMQAVKRAATAPANPSSADRSIAANASATEAQARKELQTEGTKPSESESAASESAAEEQTDTLGAATSSDASQTEVALDVTV